MAAAARSRVCWASRYRTNYMERGDGEMRCAFAHTFAYRPRRDSVSDAVGSLRTPTERLTSLTQESLLRRNMYYVVESMLAGRSG